MAAFDPVYRMTVFKPRSQQTDYHDEVEVMFPRAGALHSDPFQVATATGVAGFKPYMRPPSGRKGRVDFRSKNTDKGSLTITVLDPRVDEEATNAERWLTQFYGDADGKVALLQARAFVEESLDGGASWHPYFTGRVADVKQKSKLEFTLPLKDLSEDLDQDVFLGDFYSPSSFAETSPVPYARRARMIPYGLEAAWGDLPAVARPIPGRILGDKRLMLWTRPSTNDVRYQLMTEELAALASGKQLAGGGFTLATVWTYEVGTLKSATYIDGDFYGWFWVTEILGLWNDEKHYAINKYTLKVAPELGGAAIPAAGSNITYEIFKHGTVTAPSAILIDDVNAAQFLKDLFAGYFGILNTDGTPRYPVKINEASFAPLIADPTLPKWRGIITEADNLRTFAQTKVCQPAQLAYYLNASGEVELIDLRRPTSAVDVPEITDADLVADPGAALATFSSSDAITHIVAKLRRYRQMDIMGEVYEKGNPKFSSVPAGALQVTDREEHFSAIGDVRTLDFGKKAFEVDLTGIASPMSFLTAGPLTSALRDLFDSQRRRAALQSRLVDGLFAMLSHGAGYINLLCRRIGVGEDTQVGDRRLITCTAIADTITNLRGGTRIGVCVERSEEPGRVVLGFVDLGANEAADPPELGEPFVDGDPGLCANYVHIPITLNAEGDPVILEIAVVPYGDPQPAAGSALWEYYATALETTANFVVGPVPSASEIYFRAHSQPRSRQGLMLPSPWVFPEPASIQTCTINGPAGCAIVETDGVRVLSWTNTNTELQLQISVDGVSVAVLPSGSEEYPLNGLAGAGLVEVAYLDPAGGLSSSCSVEYEVDATVQAPRPAGIDVLKPSSITLALFPARLAAFPGVYFWWKIERAIDDGTGIAPNLGTVEVLGDNLDLGPSPASFNDPVPFTPTVYWYRAYHDLTGFLLSDPTEWTRAVAAPGETPELSILLPVVHKTQTQDDTTGTLTITIEDPQQRVTLVEMKSRPGVSIETAYAAVTGPDYVGEVLLLPGLVSAIGYRVTGYDADGVLRVLEEGTVTFGTLSPEPYAGLTEVQVPIVLLGVDRPRRYWGIDGRTAVGVQEKWSLGQFKSARLVVVVTSSTLPDTAIAGVEFENPAVPDDWHPLAVDGGPVLAVDPTSLSGMLGKAVDGAYVTIRDEARTDVRLRAVLDGCDGDDAKHVAFTRIELQPIAQDVAAAPPPETTPPAPFDPGSCDTPGTLDDFAYANLAALDAAWPEDS